MQNINKEQSSSAFGILPADLNSIFNPDKIKSGESAKLLERMGGIESLKKLLKTNIDPEYLSHTSGISKDQNDLRKRKQHFGTNEVKIQQSKSLLQMTYQNFKSDRLIRLLAYGSILSLVLGMVTEGIEEGWIEGASMLFALIIILVVNSYTTFLKIQNHTLAEINFKRSVQVIRNGGEEIVEVKDLLVGDVMIIQIGQMIPVDGILILPNKQIKDDKDCRRSNQGKQIKNDTQTITLNQEYISKQKNLLIIKSNQQPFILSGSSVINTTCPALLLVLAVGQNSFYYKISMGVKRQTPLQIKLEELKHFFANAGVYSSIIMFIIMTTRYCFDCLMHPNSWEAFMRLRTLDQLVQYFIVTIGIMVISIPEGLPLAVGITLAYSMRMMQRENIEVKHLYACETLGNTNNLIVDKTGILTKNLMKVEKVFIQQRVTSNLTKEIVNKNNYEIFRIVVCANCTNAYVMLDGKKRIGDRISYALLEMIQNIGFSSQVNTDGIIKQFQYDTERKIATTVYQKKFQQEKAQRNSNVQQQYETYVCSKGFPESLLPSCTRYFNRNGNIMPITEQFKQKLLETSQAFASQSIRVLLLAYRMCDQLIISSNRQQYQNDLICIGLVGIKDPFKQNVSTLLEILQNGGLAVRMITGETTEYAVSIAKQLGILPKQWKEGLEKKYEVMDGETFRNSVGTITNKGKTDQTIQNMQQFQKIAKELKVLTKASSNDKYLLTAGLQKLQNIVAVALTADGLGDLPILAKADVSISMQGNGIKDIEETSDIFLNDDSFSSIVTAFKWGRNIFNNIRKFLIYQTTVNLVALSMSFIGGALLKESPLSSVQMLWVNLIINTLVSLALATQHPSDQLLKTTGFAKDQKLINNSMRANIISQSIVQILVLCTILLKFPQWMGIPSSAGFQGWNQDSGRHYAIFFNVFVYFQLFNQLNTRRYDSKSSNIFGDFLVNRFFVIIFVMTFLIQLLLATFGGQAVRTVPLSIQEHALCIILGSISLVTGLIVKTLFPYGLIDEAEQTKMELSKASTSVSLHQD